VWLVGGASGPRFKFWKVGNYDVRQKRPFFKELIKYFYASKAFKLRWHSNYRKYNTFKNNHHYRVKTSTVEPRSYGHQSYVMLSCRYTKLKSTICYKETVGSSCYFSSLTSVRPGTHSVFLGGSPKHEYCSLLKLPHIQMISNDFRLTYISDLRTPYFPRGI